MKLEFRVFYGFFFTHHLFFYMMLVDSVKISTNSGYRESISSTLPKITEDDKEENDFLYVSEA